MIKIGQELYIKNLLSFRKSITQDEMKTEMKELESFLKKKEIKVIGHKISTTFSVNQAMTPTMDIEILIPIDKVFEETAKYKFKKEFKLINALKVNYKGNPQGMQQNILLMQQYIGEKNLVPISGLYTITIKEIKTSEEIDRFEADMYLSVSPNKL